MLNFFVETTFRLGIHFMRLIQNTEIHFTYT